MKPCSLLACLLPLMACGSGPAPRGADTSAPAPAAPAQSQKTLTVSAEMQKRWGINVGPVSKLSVSTSVTLPGVLSLNQKRTAHISSLVEGTVVSINADLGDIVRKGQPLVTIHSPVFAQSQVAFLQAYARMNLARKEFDRAKALLEQEAIQQKEYLRREADLEAATTDYGLQESDLHAFGMDHPRLNALIARSTMPGSDLSDLAEPRLDIVSPIDGRVIFRDVVVGEHIHPDTILFTASDLATLWAFLDAREKDLPFIGPASTVVIRCPVYPSRSFSGHNVQTSDMVDEKLRTIKIRVEVANTGLLLKPNMYIQGVVATSTASRQVLAVPEEAVQTIDGVTTVFVAQRPDTFALCPVELGDVIGTSRAITKGLTGSETIVVAGAFTLKAELMKSTLGGNE
jgi:cobalt-zinc-cadmium efflux system membrane fusion protein